MSRRSIRFLVLAAAATVSLAACGDDSSHTMATSAVVMPDGADFNDADVVFSQGMIPHHEQAIEMADMALDPTVGASAEVIALANRVRGAQDPEIEMMNGWLMAWGMPTQMDMSDGHDMSTMEGMMSADEMTALGASSGADFDRLWLEMMVQHHQGAISMATEVTVAGKNADVETLAAAIIAGQQSEIDEMKALLAT